MNQRLKPIRKPIFLGMIFMLLIVSHAEALVTDIVADVELGQIDMTHRGTNFVDDRGLRLPQGVAIDYSVVPNRIYVADGNSRVLGWADVSSFANGDPADLVIGQPDFFGGGPVSCSVGNTTASSLCDFSTLNLSDVAVDGSGNLYVSDSANSRVLEFDDPFSTDAIADRVFGQPDFTSRTCNNGGVSPSSLCQPQGIAVDGSGNLYVVDRSNHRVLEFDAPLITDTVADLVFGQPDFISNANNNGGVSPSSLSSPYGVTVDGSGNLYVVDRLNHRVLEYDAPLTDPMADRVFGQPDFFSNTDNNGGVSPSSLSSPHGVAVDGSGILYVADEENNRVLEYDAPLTTDRVADNVIGQPDLSSNTCNIGGLSASSLCAPQGLAFDASDNLYVTERLNHRLLAYDLPLTTDFVADRVLGQFDMVHNSENLIENRGFLHPVDIAIDLSVVPNRVYVSDQLNHRILGWADTELLANGDDADLVIGQPDFTTNTCNNGGVSASSLCSPWGLAVDASGNLYVGDTLNSRVLEYDSPFTTDSVADFVIGQPDFISNILGNGGFNASSLSRPLGVAVDASGNLYVADTNLNRVLEYDAPLITDAIADLSFAWPDPNSFQGCNEGGIGASSLCRPIDVEVDGSGNVYVVDGGNKRVLEYDDPLTTDRVADRVFGQPDFISDDIVTGSASSLGLPIGVAVDGSGDLYVSDVFHRVLGFDRPLTTDNVADVVFGQEDISSNPSCNTFSDTPTSNTLCTPRGLAVDGQESLYVVDERNNRVLKYTNTINQAPVADAGPDQIGIATVECTGSGVTQVTLDGSASFDPDGDLLTYTWIGGFGEVTESLVSPIIDLTGGTHIITLTVSDGQKTSSDTVTVTVTVVDTILPTITAPGHITESETGPGGQAVSLGTPVVFDSCSSILTVTNDAPALFFLGTTLVTWTVDDGNGNSATAQQTVDILDPNAPILNNVPSNIDILATSSAGAVVSYTLPTGTDLTDPNPIVVCTPPPGTTFPIGSTNVTCTVTDASGYSTSAGFVVTVSVSDIDGDGTIDVEDPCPADATNTCNVDSSAVEVIEASTGGTLTAPDGSFTLIIPPGALNQDTVISFTDVSEQGAAFSIYEMGPAGTTFNVPITVTFAWDDVDNDGIVDGTTIQEINLRIFKDNVPITDKCDQITNSAVLPYCDQLNNTFSVEISSFSEFALAIHIPIVTNPADAAVDAGVPFTGTGSFIDIDGEAWTATVDYGDGSGVTPLTLNADKSFTLSHTYSDNRGYTITVTITDDDGGVGTATTTINRVQVEEDKLFASDGEIFDLFGRKVAVSGDTVVVGAFGDDDNGPVSGSAYVFTRTGTSWTEQAKLLASDGGSPDNFGFTVAVSGDTAVVGAYGDDDNGIVSGSAYVFTRSGTTWTQQAKLLASDGMTQDRFGWSVSVSGDTVVVGASNSTDLRTREGAAYVFTRTGTTWTEQAILLPSDVTDSDLFGWSVAVSGDTVVVGAKYDDDNGDISGSAYVFTRTGITWTQQAKLLANDGRSNDIFGISVSISGNTIVVGAYVHIHNLFGSSAGAAYVFTRSGTSWTEQSELLPSDGASLDFFGWSVSVSGDTVVVAAPTNDDNGNESGSAYVFTRSGTTWTQHTKLLASDGEANDRLGFSVAVSGDSVVVGAELGSTFRVSPGAAYVFDISTNQPPVADAGLDQVGTSAVECNSVGTTSVVLNGSGSSDPDGDILTYTWTGPSGTATGINPTVGLTLGTHTLTLTVDDGQETATDTVVVTVEDTIAPIVAAPGPLTVEATGPSGQSVSIGSATATDTCDSSLTLTNNGPATFLLGTTVVTWTASDGAGNTATATQNVTVEDTTPPLVTPPADITAEATGPTTVVPLGTATAVDLVDGVVTPTPDQAGPFALGTHTIVWSATDSAGNTGTATQTVTVVDTQPPLTTNVVITPNPVEVNTALTLTATVDDNPTGGTPISNAEFSIDGGAFVPMNATDGTFNSATEDVSVTGPAFTVAGVHTICVRGTDAAGNVGEEECTFLAVYDPDGGFVTGGGWINSPLGAYTENPSLTGKANFGFVSKYKKGATTPTGQTQFKFKAGGLNFHSSIYEWLVVAGARAQYKGSGTINGTGNYGFMLTAIDGQINGGGGSDKFRIKIWDKNNGDVIVYDNQFGGSDDSDPSTLIGGGSIIIHK